MFRIGDDDRKSPRHSPKTSPRRSPIMMTSSNGTPKHMKKQDSYTMAIEEESDPEDYIDKEINRKITLKRAETVKTVVKECINENDDILFKIKRRARAEQEAMKRFRVDKENEYNDQMMMEDSNANIQSSRPRSSDRVDNRLEEVVNEFKKSPHLQRKTLEEIPVDDLPDLNDKDFAHAAILIQSAFKGFKVRRELEEMKAFHRNMSQPICEEHSPKPEHRAPEKAGRRQNSYIEAVCSPPDSFADDAPPTKRPWKTRQESYNEAINQQPDGGNKSSEEWKNRQNSYLQAIGTASLDPSVGSSEQQNGKSTNKNTVRQDSYQKAVSSVSPNTSISEDSKKDPKFRKRQDSYQKAVESQSDKSKSLSEPAYKKRQSSYQKAMSDNSTISESVNQKNIKNSKNKERKDAASKEEKQRKKDVKESDPKLGDKLKKTSHKKQSKSPRRRPEAYQRPPSSSEEEDTSASLKRSHKPRGAGKKQLDKQKSGGKEAKSGATISTFSGAADVVNAAIKIQVAYRGYRARCEIREHHDSVEIGDEEVNEPSNKKDNKKKSTKTERPKKDVNRGAWADVVNSCITIQRAYRKYQRNKILRDIGVDNCDKAEEAIVRIQAHYKGFQTRKTMEQKPVKSEVRRDTDKGKVRKPQKIAPVSQQSKVSKKSVVNLDVQPKKRPLRTETYVVEEPFIKRSQAAQVASAALRIQSWYRGYKARKELGLISLGSSEEFDTGTIKRRTKRTTEEDELPDLNDKEIADAAIKIQAVYKGFKIRQKIEKKKQLDDDLPDLNDKDIADAAVKIQAVYKGFKIRKRMDIKKSKKNDDLPDLNDSDLADAAVKIQSVYKGFKIRQTIKKKQLEDDLPDLNDGEVVDAAMKIQAGWKGFKTRKQMKDMGTVIAAVMTIQSAFRKYKARKLARNDSLPDLECSEVQEATVKIQSAYRGFKTRQVMKNRSAADVVFAVLRIQRAFKRYKLRKLKRAQEEDLPDLESTEVKEATVKIQSAYRGFQTRRKMKDTQEVAMAAMKIQLAFKRFKARKEKERRAKLQAEIKAKQDAVMKAKKEAIRAKEITAKPHPKEPMITLKSKQSDAPKRRQRHDSKQQTPISQIESKTEHEMKIKKEAMTYFGNLVPEKGMPVSKKPHVPSPLAAKESKPVTSTIKSSHNQSRKKKPKAADVVRSAMIIQRAFKRYKKRKELQDLPDLKADDVVAATIKIQSAYKGFKTRREVKKNKEALPDLNLAEVQDATLKIQSAYRGFKTRKELRDNQEDLPDLNAADVAAAAIKIQSAYKGFKTRKATEARKEQKARENMQKAAAAMQAKAKPESEKETTSYFGRFMGSAKKEESKQPKPESTSYFGRFMGSGKKEENKQPKPEPVKETTEKKSIFGFFARTPSQKDMKAVVEDATKKDNSLKGKTTSASTNKARSNVMKSKTEKKEDLPNLKDPEVQEAAVRIQSAFRGHKTRQTMKSTATAARAAATLKSASKQQSDASDLPDLQCSQVKDATIKIQSAYRGFQTRKSLKHTADVVNAAITIQSAFKKYKKRKLQQEEDLPDLSDSQVQDATIKIQSAYRGFRTRKEMQHSGQTLPKSKPSDVAKSAILIQTYYRGFKARKAFKDQQKRQDKITSDLSEAAFRVSLPSSSREKKALKNLPKTPMQSVDLPTVPGKKPTKPSRPAVPPTSRGIRPSVPKQVDERDFRNRPKRPLRPAPAAVSEDRSKELQHHPADIVAAAMTIQRFFRMVKEKKEKSKRLRSTRSLQSTTSASTTSTASTTESSTEESTTEQSDSSDAYEEKTMGKESSSESESEEESTVKFGSIKRKPKPQEKVAQKMQPKEVKKPQKSVTSESSETDSNRKGKKSSSSSESESDEESKSTVRASSIKKKANAPTFKSPEVSKVKDSSSELIKGKPSTNVKEQKPTPTIQSDKNEPRSGGGMFGGIFGAKKTAESAKSKATAKPEEKKSMFGFFSKSEKEDQPQPMKTEVKKKVLKSTEAQKMSVIKTFRGEEPKARKLSSDEELPDLKDKEVEAATLKIQSSYRGFRIRKQVEEKKKKAGDVVFAAMTIQRAFKRYRKRKIQRQLEADLPDLNSKDVQDATVKIQSSFRGFQARKQVKAKKKSAGDVVFAAMTIQRAFKRYKKRKIQKQLEESLPDLNSKDVQDATVKIQSSFRGFQARKQVKAKKKSAGDVVFAAMTIQRAFKRYKKRKIQKQLEEDLPDLNSKDVQDATVKIQSSFRGFQARKQVKAKKKSAGDVVFAAMTIQRAFKRYKKRKLMNEQGLPDLKCAQVQEATLKIQSAYRGFRTRQDVKSKKNNTADVMFAAIRIQRAYKRYKVRKQRREIEEGLPDLNSAEVKDAAVKIQSVYRGFQTRRVGRKKVAKSSSDSSESDEESKTKRRASSDSSESESEDEFKKPPRPSTVRRPPKAKARPLKSRKIPDSSATESATATDTDVEDVHRRRRKVPDSSATESQSEPGESLPDLDDSDVEDAALKIQSAFRGFQARKNVTTLKKTPKMGDVMHSVITIQRSFRRYKKRKQERKKAAMILQKEKLAKESKKISSKVSFALLKYPFSIFVHIHGVNMYTCLSWKNYSFRIKF